MALFSLTIGATLALVGPSLSDAPFKVIILEKLKLYHPDDPLRPYRPGPGDYDDYDYNDDHNDDDAENNCRLGRNWTQLPC